MRITVTLVSALLLAAACSGDNASPFAHGAKNKPGTLQTTRVPRSGPTGNDKSSTAQYDRSTGQAGGYRNEPVGGAPAGSGAGASASPQPTGASASGNAAGGTPQQ
jgi:hypothetical protein